MRIRLKEDKNHILLTKDNFILYENKEVMVLLEDGIGCIKTNAPDNSVIDSAVKGTDSVYKYHYFLFDIPKQNNGKTFIYDGYSYTYLLTGEAPLTITEEALKPLNIYKKPEEDTKGEMDYNLIAASYFNKYSFRKYNDDYYFFHPLKKRWMILNHYDDYNILISLENRNYLRRDKSQIMDSLQIYLDGLENEILDKDLLLFKNDKVLNIMTEEVFDFDGTHFILRSLNANWYEKDYPKGDYYMEKLLNDICGINEYSGEEEKNRRRDLEIYLGYMLTEMQKQNGLVLFGKAQNGKSTLARLISKVKGSAFSPRVASLISDTHYSSGFYNERILFFDELKPKMVTEEFVSIFNQLLGNSNMSIRPMQREPRSVLTNFTAIITANEVSPQFFTNRALLRRIKIMNSMFPVVTNLPPNINFDDELQKQDNIDWLANHAIRAFIKNDYRIDNLFVDDIKWWLSSNNAIVKKFLTMLKDDGLVDDKWNIIVDREDFMSIVSQFEDLKKDLNVRKTIDPVYFDEQINIAFMYVLFTPELSSKDGSIIWRE